MHSPRNIPIFAFVIGAAWLVTFTGIAAFSGIAKNQYEHLLGGRPLPPLTSATVALHQHFGIASAILVFSTFAFGSYLLAWRLREPADFARGAVCVLALTFTAILFYIFASVTALLLPFITIIGQLELNPTNTSPSIYWPLLWIVLAVIYGVGLVVVARRLKW